MKSPIPHLLPEALSPSTRLHVLRKLRKRMDQGCQEPAMLYSGARFAASLGLAAEARRFLDPLLPILETDGNPSHASFGPLLLALHLSPAHESHTAQAKLLATKTESLRNGWDHFCGQAYDHKTMPQSVLDRLRTTPALLHPESISLLDQAWAEAQPETARALQAAAASYAAAHLDEARATLEDILEDGTPATREALLTLIAVTSELQDHSGLERYWRRYVKLLLWSWTVRADDSALIELAKFYRTTAAAADRQFSAAGNHSMSDLLRSPGLVARWLESHAALVWIDAFNPAANRTFYPSTEDDISGSPRHLRKFWFQTFYPEFTTNVSSKQFPPVPLPPRLSADERKLDPAWRLLSRYAEWSKTNFGIRPADEIDSSHFQMMLALSGMVSRIPVAAHVTALLNVLKADDLGTASFRYLWQNAVSTPLQIVMNRYCTKEQWKEACSRKLDLLPDDQASPGLQALRALALMREVREPLLIGIRRSALSVMVTALPSFEAAHVESDALEASIFKAAARFRAKELIEERDQPMATRRDNLGKLITSIQDAKRSPIAEALVADCVEELTTLADEMHIEELVDEVMEAVQKGINDDDFTAAERAVARLPDTPERCLELRKNLEKQVREIRTKHEERQHLEKLWKDVLEQVKKCVRKGDFAGAHKAVARLPDNPPDIKEGKDSLAKQVNESAADWAKAERENPSLLRLISPHNLDIPKMAASSEVDTRNVIQYNHFLKAVIEMLNKR